MPQTSFALMTNLGRAKEAAAFASATTVEITHIAIGDGATVPSGGETSLYNQLALKTISGSGTVVGADNVAYFDCFLEAAEGPYTIREAGLYDVDGDLIAIAHYDPPINKPIPASGQTVEGTVRLEVAFSNVANITISIDPSLQVALQRLTRLPWLPIISMTLATPPASPVAGDTYLIATSPTGSWSGQAGKIAEYTTAGWAIIAPPEGHGVSLPDGRVFERISGTYIEKIALDSQSGKWVYAADSGAVNALAITLAPVPAAYVAGMSFRIKAANSNTGATTLNVNGLGTKDVARHDGSVLLDSDIISGAMDEYIYDGTKFLMPGANATPALKRALTLYVNGAIGNDSNDGISNTSGHALASIQGAVNRAFSYGPGPYTVTVNVASGTYGPVVTPQQTGPNIVVIGDEVTPANVVVSAGTSADAFAVHGANNVTARGLKVQTGTPGNDLAGFIAYTGATLTTANTESGTVDGAVFEGFGGGAINVGAHKFSGDSRIMFWGNVNGSVSLQGVYTITTTIALGSACAQSTNNATLAASGSTPPSFVNPSNVTSGNRYIVTLNGIINTNGGGATFFPGGDNIITTGGQYV